MIYFSRTNRETTQKYIKFAKKGLPNSVELDPLDIVKKTDCDRVILFGILRGTNVVYRWAEEHNIDFYYMDRPYWGDSRSHPYWLRIVKNNHVKNNIEPRPDDRFKKTFPWEISSYHKLGKKIMVCPPTDSISVFFNCENWLENTIKILKENTDREIVVRDKPYNPEARIGKDGVIYTGKNKTNAIKEKINWREYHAVVTFNSSITVKALANGVPVFTNENNCAYPVAEHDFSKIERPRYEDPRPLFYSLAYGQFTAEEMSNGYAWDILDGR